MVFPQRSLELPGAELSCRDEPWCGRHNGSPFRRGPWCDLDYRAVSSPCHRTACLVPCAAAVGNVGVGAETDAARLEAQEPKES